MYFVLRTALLICFLSQAAIAKEERTPSRENANSPLTATRTKEEILPALPNSPLAPALPTAAEHIPAPQNSPLARPLVRFAPAQEPASLNSPRIVPERFELRCGQKFAVLGRKVQLDLASRPLAPAQNFSLPVLGLGAVVLGAGPLSSDKDPHSPYSPEIMRAIYTAQGGLANFKAKRVSIPFSWGEWMLDAELAELPPSRLSDPALLKKRYAEIVRESKVVYDSAAGTDAEKFDKVREFLFKERLHTYCAGKAGLVDFDVEGCGNCEAQTRLYTAVLLDAKIPIPHGTQFGAQLYDDHIQPVLFGKKSGRTEVMNLVTGAPKQVVDGPIYAPELLLWAYVNAKIKPGEANFDLVVDRDRDLLLLGVDVGLGSSPTSNRRDPSLPSSSRSKFGSSTGRNHGGSAPTIASRKFLALGKGEDEPRREDNGAGITAGEGRPRALLFDAARVGAAKEFSGEFALAPFRLEEASGQGNFPLKKQNLIFRSTEDLARWQTLTDAAGQEAFLRNMIRKHALAYTTHPAVERTRARLAGLRDGTLDLAKWAKSPAEELAEEKEVFTELLVRLDRLSHKLQTVAGSYTQQYEYHRALDPIGKMEEISALAGAFRDEVQRDPLSFLQKLDKGGAAALTGLDIVDFVSIGHDYQGIKLLVAEVFKDPKVVGFRRPLLRPGESLVEFDLRESPEGTEREIGRERAKSPPNPAQETYDGEANGTVKNPSAKVTVDEEVFVRLFGSQGHRPFIEALRGRWTPELAATFARVWNGPDDQPWEALTKHLSRVSQKWETTPELDIPSHMKEAFAKEPLLELRSPNFRYHIENQSRYALPESLAKLFVLGMEKRGDNSWSAVPIGSKEADSSFNALQEVNWKVMPESREEAEHIVKFLRGGFAVHYTPTGASTMTKVTVDCTKKIRTCDLTESGKKFEYIPYDVAWGLVEKNLGFYDAVDPAGERGTEPIVKAVATVREIRSKITDELNRRASNGAISGQPLPGKPAQTAPLQIDINRR